MRKNYAFTFIEIVIAVMIMALTAGAVCWKIKENIDTHRFHAQTKHIAATLKKLQILSLTYGVDMFVEIQKKRGQWELSSKINEESLDHYKNEKYALGAITRIVSESSKSAQEVPWIKFTVTSTGKVEPPILLKMQHDQKVMWLDLRDPLQIVLSPTKRARPIDAPLEKPL